MQSLGVDRAHGAETAAVLRTALALGICRESLQSSGRVAHTARHEIMSTPHAQTQWPLAPPSTAKRKVDSVPSRQQHQYSVHSRCSDRKMWLLYFKPGVTI